MTSDGEIRFVARMGTMGSDKFHVLIPKAFNNFADKVAGRQVKVTITEEI